MKQRYGQFDNFRVPDFIENSHVVPKDVFESGKRVFARMTKEQKVSKEETDMLHDMIFSGVMVK